MDWKDEVKQFFKMLSDVGLTISKDEVFLLSPGLAQKFRSYYEIGRQQAGRDMTLKIGKIIQAIVSE